MNWKCKLFGHDYLLRRKVIELEETNDRFPPIVTIVHRYCKRCDKVQYYRGARVNGLMYPGSWADGEVKALTRLRQLG